MWFDAQKGDEQMTNETERSRSSKPDRHRTISALEHMLSVQEVAEVLGVPKSCVYYLVKAHGLPVRKISKYFRFSQRELRQWIDEQKESK